MEFVNLYVMDIMRRKSGGLIACCCRNPGETVFCSVDTDDQALHLTKQGWEWVPTYISLQDNDELEAYTGRSKLSLVRQINRKIIQGNVRAAHDLLMRLSEDIMELLPSKHQTQEISTEPMAKCVCEARDRLAEILRKAGLAAELLDNAISADPVDGCLIL